MLSGDIRPLSLGVALGTLPLRVFTRAESVLGTKRAGPEGGGVFKCLNTSFNVAPGLGHVATRGKWHWHLKGR